MSSSSSSSFTSSTGVSPVSDAGRDLLPFMVLDAVCVAAPRFSSPSFPGGFVSDRALSGSPLDGDSSAAASPEGDDVSSPPNRAFVIVGVGWRHEARRANSRGKPATDRGQDDNLIFSNCVHQGLGYPNPSLPSVSAWTWLSRRAGGWPARSPLEAPPKRNQVENGGKTTGAHPAMTTHFCAAPRGKLPAFSKSRAGFPKSRLIAKKPAQLFGGKNRRMVVIESGGSARGDN